MQGSDSRLSSFLEWCGSRSIRFDSVQIRSAGEGAGNGIFALENQRENSVLIELPLEEILIAGRVADMPRYRRLIEETGLNPNPFELLVAFFYLEEETTSEYGPYLTMLPRSFDTPVAVGLQLKAEDLPLSMRTFWQQQQNELEDIKKRLPSFLPSPIDENKLMWAWHVVNTRCIYVENESHPLVDTSRVDDTIAVVPFVDMLNHDPHAQCLAEVEKKNGRYVVKATRAVSQGTELYVCYGPHDNGRLWMEYGFRLPLNPFMKVIIPTDLFLALAQKARSDVKISEAHKKAVEDAALPNTLYATDEGPSWGLRTNVRLLHMNRKEIGDWRSIVYRDEPRRNSPETEDEEEEEDMEEGRRERLTHETATIIAILQALEKAVKARTNQASEVVRWLWEEQRAVIEVSVKRAEKELERLKRKMTNGDC